MHLHVLSEGDGGSKALPTLRTSVGLFGRMHHLVGFQIECVDANFANELYASGDITLLLHVDFHVGLQAGVYSKAFSTVNTDVGVGGFVNLKVLMEICDAAENLTTLIALQAVGLVNNHAVFRLHCELPAMVGFSFDDVIRPCTTHLCLEENFTQEGFIALMLNVMPSKALEASLIRLCVVMVCLYNLVSINTSHSAQLRAQALYFGQV